MGWSACRTKLVPVPMVSWRMMYPAACLSVRKHSSLIRWVAHSALAFCAGLIPALFNKGNMCIAF